MNEGEIRVCGLCGHAMVSLRTCGSAAVNDIPLCHADDHDCYRAWTVYGVRPGWLPGTGYCLPPVVERSVELARAHIAAEAGLEMD
jgi:hypothetical protein